MHVSLKLSVFQNEDPKGVKESYSQSQPSIMFIWGCVDHVFPCGCGFNPTADISSLKMKLDVWGPVIGQWW